MPFAYRSERRIVWAVDRRGHPVAEVPTQAARYFATHQRRLALRADYQSGPPWTLFRTEAGLAKYRVIWPDLARQLQAVALIGPASRLVVPLNTCYWIATESPDESLALAAWLNSRPIREHAKRRATVAASGYSRFNAELVGGVPLVAEAMTDPVLIELSRSAHGEGLIDQGAIDRRVDALLGLG